MNTFNLTHADHLKERFGRQVTRVEFCPLRDGMHVNVTSYAGYNPVGSNMLPLAVARQTWEKFVGKGFVRSK